MMCEKLILSHHLCYKSNVRLLQLFYHRGQRLVDGHQLTVPRIMRKVQGQLLKLINFSSMKKYFLCNKLHMVKAAFWNPVIHQMFPACINHITHQIFPDLLKNKKTYIPITTDGVHYKSLPC